jgi:hypothetical protein
MIPVIQKFVVKIFSRITVSFLRRGYELFQLALPMNRKGPARTDLNLASIRLAAFFPNSKKRSE